MLLSAFVYHFHIGVHILADHEHPFWPMVNTNSGAS